MIAAATGEPPATAVANAPRLPSLPFLPSVPEAVRDQVGPLGQWMANNGGKLLSVPLRIVLILVVAILLRYAARRLVNRIIQRMVNNPIPVPSGYRKRGKRAIEAHQRIASERREQRAKTVGSVLGSIATVVIFATAFVMILGLFEVNLGPIIASAGIVGLAIGFGAQSLVSDFLSGMFMLMEDQYGVGDWVDVGEASGTVEEVGLRVTQLRDGNGVLWFVRNGEIVRVGNHSQDWARALLDVPVAYGEDVQAVSALLKETAWTLWDDEDFKYLVLEEPEIWGVETLSREAVVIRLAVKTAPLEQWGVARELRRRIKEAFDQRGVQIPLQQQAIWMRDGDPPAGTLSRDIGETDGQHSPVEARFRGE